MDMGYLDQIKQDTKKEIKITDFCNWNKQDAGQDI